VKETPVTRSPYVRSLLALGVFLLSSLPARAQGANIFQPGPSSGALGSYATIQVPRGFVFVNQANMRELKRQMRELPNPKDLGALIPAGPDGKTPDSNTWMIIFGWDNCGYVKDDEKNKLDADAILQSYREGTEAGNAERRKQGMAELHVTGWHTKPFFDDQSKNLEWAMLGESQGQTILNYNSRLLGRHGVMEAVLIAAPQELDAVLPKYKEMLKGFSFNSGEKYAEFREGDKVAEFGLAALAGGVGVAALAKSGLLGKLIKPIIAGVVALFAGIGALFKKIFGGKQATE
jgi:uncharacterized membrane-anchored protein